MNVEFASDIPKRYGRLDEYLTIYTDNEFDSLFVCNTARFSFIGEVKFLITPE